MMSLYTGAVLLFTKKNTSLTGDASMTFYRALGQGSVLGIPVPVIILLVVAAIPQGSSCERRSMAATSTPWAAI